MIPKVLRILVESVTIYMNKVLFCSVLNYFVYLLLILRSESLVLKWDTMVINTYKIHYIAFSFLLTWLHKLDQLSCANLYDGIYKSIQMIQVTSVREGDIKQKPHFTDMSDVIGHVLIRVRKRANQLLFRSNVCLNVLNG